MTKVGQVLKFKDTGLSVDDARKAMFAAGEAPSGIRAKSAAVVLDATVVPTAVVPPVAEDFEEEIEAVTPPVAATPTAATTPPVVVAPPKVERIETSQFVGEIKRDGNKWVAEIKYKTGAGTEKFTANTKDDLLLKLLEGKGHATLRVNKAVRREKLGWSELDRQYPLPEGISAKDFEEMTDKAQDALLWSIATQQIVAFNEAHPEYYKDPEGKNAKKINDFLVEHHLPITLRNLEYAFDELTDTHLPADVRLEERPVASTTLVSPASTITPAQTDSVSVAEAPPAAVPTATVVPAAPVITVRKRGSTGLQPGHSSSETELSSPEVGSTPRELSEAELRKLPLSELKRIATQDRLKHSSVRR